jgi:hypothetical protein
MRPVAQSDRAPPSVLVTDAKDPRSQKLGDASDKCEAESLEVVAHAVLDYLNGVG